VFNLADFNGRSRKTRFLILKHGHQNCHDQKHKFHPLFDTQRCQAFLGAADSSARNSSRTAHLGMWSMGKEKEQVKEKEKNIVLIITNKSYSYQYIYGNNYQLKPN
jgi:hypothetical protein